MAAFGNAVTFVNSVGQRQLEELKSEQTRILEMIKTGNPETAARNLGFLLKVGLISNPRLARNLASTLTRQSQEVALHYRRPTSEIQNNPTR